MINQTPKEFAESMLRLEDSLKAQRTRFPKSENDKSQQVRVRNEWHRLLKLEAWERGMHISEVLGEICCEHFEKTGAIDLSTPKVENRDNADTTGLPS